MCHTHFPPGQSGNKRPSRMIKCTRVVLPRALRKSNAYQTIWVYCVQEVLLVLTLMQPHFLYNTDTEYYLRETSRSGKVRERPGPPPALARAVEAVHGCRLTPGITWVGLRCGGCRAALFSGPFNMNQAYNAGKIIQTACWNYRVLLCNFILQKKQILDNQ